MGVGDGVAVGELVGVGLGVAVAVLVGAMLAVEVGLGTAVGTGLRVGVTVGEGGKVEVGLGTTVTIGAVVASGDGCLAGVGLLSAGVHATDRVTTKESMARHRLTCVFQSIQCFASIMIQEVMSVRGNDYTMTAK